MNILKHTEMGDLKVLAFNASTMMISFSTVEDALQMVLLLASIGYTLQRWRMLVKDKQKEE